MSNPFDKETKPSKEDRRLSGILKYYITLFDGLAFPKKSLAIRDYDGDGYAEERRRLGDEGQPGNLSFGRLCHIDSPIDRRVQFCYIIHSSGMELFFNTIKSKIRHMFAPISSGPFTEMECAVGLAVHEVRHRWQQENNLNGMFSPVHLPRIKLLQPLGFVFLREKGLYHPVTNEFNAKEFDALIVEHLAAWVVNMKNQRIHDRLYRIISLTPATFDATMSSFMMYD